MIKKIYVVCFVLFGILNSNAQKMLFSDIEKFPQEKIHVHTNSNFFLTGEPILFKIYCLIKSANTSSTLSKVGYVELIDSANKSIYKQKVMLKNGEGNGDLFLDGTLKSGTYKLISYTQWMRNTQTFFEETIFIINPFEEKISLSDSLKKNNFTPIKTKNTNLIPINSNKKNYQKREKVIVDFQNSVVKNGSISIRKKEDIATGAMQEIVTFYQEDTNLISRSKENYLPELRGELFQGKVTSDQITNLENLKIGLSFLGNPKITKIATTNKKGVFYFNISKPYEAENVIIELLESNKTAYKVSILKDTSLEKNFEDFTALFLTEELRQVIKERSLHIQIENAYSQVKPSNVGEIDQNKFIFNNNVNKVIYQLDDYTRFKTIQDVAIEILQDVWISKKDDTYAFHLRDINLESNTDLETLLIVDGFIVHDHSNFIFYDALKIKSIEIVKEKYYFGANVYQGIINVNTFNDAYKPNVNDQQTFALLKPHLKKQYFSPDYDANLNARIPDMRIQLYWNSNITKETKQVSFFTSDNPGTYEIIFKGITMDDKPIFETSTFYVK